MFGGAQTQTGIDAEGRSIRVKVSGGGVGFISVETAMLRRQLSQTVG